MSLTITNTTKNGFTITNDDKGLELTWAEATFTWDNAEGTFATQRVVLTKASKNTLSISNISKN